MTDVLQTAMHHSRPRSGGQAFGAAPISGGARWLSAAVSGIVAVGAVYGGIALLRDPQGLGAEPSWLRGSPIPDYTLPGLVLLAVIGVGMLLTATLVMFGHGLAGGAALVMAGVLAVWGIVETATIGYRGLPQIVLLAAFVVAPAVVLGVCGWRAVRRRGVRTFPHHGSRRSPM